MCRSSPPQQRTFLDLLDSMQESLGKLNDMEPARAIAPPLAAEQDDGAATADLIAAAQQAHAGLKDKIVFVGKAQKFQIWDTERYAPIEAEAIARVKAKMERARNGDAS